MEESMNKLLSCECKYLKTNYISEFERLENEEKDGYRTKLSQNQLDYDLADISKKFDSKFRLLISNYKKQAAEFQKHLYVLEYALMANPVLRSSRVARILLDNIMYCQAMNLMY